MQRKVSNPLGDNPFSVDRILGKTNEGRKSNRVTPTSFDVVLAQSKTERRCCGLPYDESKSVLNTRCIAPCDIVTRHIENPFIYDSKCCCCMEEQQYCSTCNKIEHASRTQPFSHHYVPLRAGDLRFAGSVNQRNQLENNSCTSCCLYQCGCSPLPLTTETSRSEFVTRSLIQLPEDLLKQDASSYYFNLFENSFIENRRCAHHQVTGPRLEIGLKQVTATEKQFDWMTNPRPFYRKENKWQSKHSNSKRDRTTFSKKQRAELERQFHISRYPSRYHRSQIATYLNLTEFQVKVWFQNRRMKFKRWNSAVRNADNFIPSCYCTHTLSKTP